MSSVPWFAAPSATSPRPWYFDGRDICAGERRDDRIIIPLPPSQRVRDEDARLVVQAVNNYEAALYWLARAEASLWNPHDGHTINDGGNFHGSFVHDGDCRWCAFRAANSHPRTDK